MTPVVINTIETKLKDYQNDFVQMKNVDGLLKNVMPYLGKIDAAKEWNDNPKVAYKMFLHTKSYHQFISEDSLILLGRTGTGKTAILRCLCENVNNNNISDYDYAVIVPFNEILYNLVNTTDDFSSSAIIKTQLMRSITMYFNCYIMKTLIKYRLADGKSKMRTYIQNNNLYDIGDIEYSRSGMNKFRNMVTAFKKMNNKAEEIANNIITVMDVVNAFTENGYEDAYDEMMEILKSHKILVLVDTLNEYDLRDIKIVMCMKALIATCFDYYNIAAQNHIYVKISIPSEIHTQLIEQLPGKQQGNTVVIQWSYNDLLKMIAIRLLYFSKTNQIEFFKFDDEYNFSDFYEDNSNAADAAKRMIYEFLPEICPTFLDYSFGTLSYCIKHTLKKPREIMAIFNSFISIIKEKQDFKYFIKNPQEISDVVHSTQEELITSAISMYTTSYPNILGACEIVLHGQYFYFQGKDLENRLKEAEVNKAGYDKNDIKRILLESGLVGKINEISYITCEEKVDSTLSRTNVRVIKAKFEYQVKGRLSLNKDDFYVLHPMCYEHFECMLDAKTLVYPESYNNDVEWMKSVKIKKWD